MQFQPDLIEQKCDLKLLFSFPFCLRRYGIIDVYTPVHICMHVHRHACIYRSVPGKRPPHGKRPVSHFRQMNGERPLPGKCPGILSTV